ncbi:hypothetical protein L798_00949 [Zootermopsis nevadensis]|uniref:Uncharacterized protein n=1 Tax=Zootermopsis nevadensis TaxID=136037 RepID=A0A067QMF6_ZOONE|nr:hypothetical protein L798_00949 [Zootermopsis nevadensis]
MPRLSHSSRLNHPDNIGGGVKIFKLIIMQFFHVPASSLLGPNILLKHLQSVFLPQSGRPCFAPNDTRYGHPFYPVSVFVTEAPEILTANRVAANNDACQVPRENILHSTVHAIIKATDDENYSNDHKM